MAFGHTWTIICILLHITFLPDQFMFPNEGVFLKHFFHTRGKEYRSIAWNLLDWVKVEVYA